ncbi:hypothetical protein ACJ6WD_11090 [Streptomyces sp. VTCC 41912]|uniref:hypothetical protein n=1 Tax=Streptomyces TaxID=1883 RepID=UPI003451111D
MNVEDRGSRMPVSAAEVVDEALVGDALAQAVEDGLVKCVVHLSTGLVVYMAAGMATAA